MATALVILIATLTMWHLSAVTTLRSPVTCPPTWLCHVDDDMRLTVSCANDTPDVIDKEIKFNDIPLPEDNATIAPEVATAGNGAKLSGIYYNGNDTAITETSIDGALNSTEADWKSMPGSQPDTTHDRNETVPESPDSVTGLRLAVATCPHSVQWQAICLLGEGDPEMIIPDPIAGMDMRSGCLAAVESMWIDGEVAVGFLEGLAVQAPALRHLSLRHAAASLHLLNGTNTTGLSGGIRSLDLSQNLLSNIPTFFTTVAPPATAAAAVADDDAGVGAGGAALNVSLLNVSHNALSRVPWSQLVGLTNLLTLDLSYNLLGDLSGLPTAGDVPTARIRSLSLSHNLIEHLPYGLWDGLPQLRELDISHNSLHVVGEDAFPCSLRALSQLDLSGNRIASLEKGAFRDLKTLKVLNLSHNALSVIDGDAFTAVESRVECRPGPSEAGEAVAGSPQGEGSQQKEWKKKTNDGKGNAERERARNPHDPTSGTDVLDAWPQLWTLDLRHNNITWVDKSLFRSAAINVRELLLSHNAISHFPRYGIERLPLLQRVDLSHNKLFWLDVGTFTSRTLRYVDLSHNSLRKVISMTFLFLPRIQLVDLSHNELSYIYKVAFYKTCKYDQEFEVRLAHNRLETESLWKMVSSFRHLTGSQCVASFDFSHNLMKGILGDNVDTYRERLEDGDLTYFQMWDNVVIQMEGNPLKCNCKLQSETGFLQQVAQQFADNITNSEHLYFWQNLTCQRPHKLVSRQLPDALSLLDCPVDWCPNHCACVMQQDTIIINCTGKGLIYFPDDMPSGQKAVYLADNYITYIEDGPHLDNITFLDVSANALTRIAPGAWRSLTRSARTILLHNNYLYQLPEIVESLDGMSGLTLRGNPLSCTCFDVWFITWFRRHRDVIKDAGRVRCGSGEAVLALNESSICPDLSAPRPGHHVSWEHVALAVTFCCLGVIAVIVILAGKFRRRMLASCPTRWNWYRVHVESEPKHDVLVLYGQEDEDWATATLQRALLQHLPDSSTSLINLTELGAILDDPRDSWMALSDTMENSRRVVLVVSPAFLAREWRQDGLRRLLLHHRDQHHRPSQPSQIALLRLPGLESRDLRQLEESGLSASDFISVEERDPQWLQTLLQRVAPDMTSAQLALDDIRFTDETTLRITEKY